MRTLARLLSLVVLSGLLVAPVSAGAVEPDRPATRAQAPAHAEPLARKRNCANGRPSRFFRDSTGERGVRGHDMTGIGVWNKDRDACYWVTATGRFSAAKAQVIRVVIDSDRRYDGYEYEAWAYSSKDSDSRRGAYLIRFTSPEDSHYVQCRLFSSYLLGRGEIRIGIPKTCLGSPGHIRLQAMVGDITRYLPGNRYRAHFDYVPEGRYTPLV